MLNCACFATPLYLIGRTNPPMPSTFDPEKAVAAIGYLVERTGEDMYMIMKMMYVADRLHLGEHGRFIAGDYYSAMERGPVPSNAYNMLKHVRGETQNAPWAGLASAAFEYGAGHQIKLKHAPRLDELSESDIGALAEVVALLGRHGRDAMVRMSHDKAWEGSRRGLGWLKARSMPIENIAAQTVGDTTALIEHLRDPNPGSA